LYNYNKKDQPTAEYNDSRKSSKLLTSFQNKELIKKRIKELKCRETKDGIKLLEACLGGDSKKVDTILAKTKDKVRHFGR
jgi:hypothetical protein